MEVFLTGATGYIGKVLLYHLLQRDDVVRIHVLVRAKRGVDPATRFETTIKSSRIYTGDLACKLIARANVVEGDLANIPALPASVTHIVHCAASISFNLPIMEAVATNVDPSMAIMERSLALKNLVSFVHISTAYVCPTGGGSRVLIDMGADPDLLCKCSRRSRSPLPPPRAVSEIAPALRSNDR